jgi:hydroxypyruvate isomerase
MIGNGHREAPEVASRHWHMRYAGHLGLRAPDSPLFQHSAGSIAAADQIRFLADLGFAGVQDNFLELRSLAEQELIGAQIARLGLEMGSFTGNPQYWNSPLWNATDAGSRSTLRKGLDASIDAARRVNGCVVGCVTGVMASSPRDRQIAAMIDNLKLMAEPAARAGIVLCVEAVAAQWIPGLLVRTIGEAAHIVQAVDSPAVRLMFDVGHVQMSDGHVIAHLENCWAHIGAIQVADAPGRIDLGAGELHWPTILRTIRNRGWSGLIEIEHMPVEETAAGERRLIERLRAIDAALS